MVYYDADHDGDGVGDGGGDGSGLCAEHFAGHLTEIPSSTVPVSLNVDGDGSGDVDEAWRCYHETGGWHSDARDRDNVVALCLKSYLCLENLSLVEVHASWDLWATSQIPTLVAFPIAQTRQTQCRRSSLPA